MNYCVHIHSAIGGFIVDVRKDIPINEQNQMHALVAVREIKKAMEADHILQSVQDPNSEQTLKGLNSLEGQYVFMEVSKMIEFLNQLYKS